MTKNIEIEKNFDRLHKQCLICSNYNKQYNKHCCKLKRRCNVDFRCRDFNVS